MTGALHAYYVVALVSSGRHCCRCTLGMTGAFHTYCVVALVSSGRHCCRCTLGMTGAFHAYCVVALVSSGRHCCCGYFRYDRSLASSAGVASSVLPQLTACPVTALAVLTHSLTLSLTHSLTHSLTDLLTY